MIGRGRLYVVVNEDLKMSAGKVAAQVAHVTARLNLSIPKVVVVLGGTTEQLKNLRQYLNDNKIPSAYYIDEGVNEVPPMSLTTVAFKAGTETPEFIEGFELYVDPTPYKLEGAEFQVEILKQQADFYKKQAEEWRKSYMEMGKWPWQK